MDTNKTVAVYSDGEFANQGLTGAIKNKSNRKSFFIPLICSIIAAFGLWLFVIWGNNTCTGIPIEVVGNAQLMSNNYTVSAVEPATVDLVFKGKDEVIKRITDDPSLISASVYVFSSVVGAEIAIDGIFEKEDEIAPGVYTVELMITAPEGVSCSTKTVKVTVSKASVKEFSTEQAGSSKDAPVRLNMSNYSFANGISLDSQSVVEKSVTVIGDQTRVEAIEYISLNVDWLKDLTGDATVFVTPVACDRYGDVIDSEFLRFEPATLEVNVKVNKQKTLTLVPKKAADDTATYTLSVPSVTVIGPVLEIDRLSDTLEITVGQDLPSRHYTVAASSLGSNVRFLTKNGEIDAFTLIADKKVGTVTKELLIKAENVIVLSPEDLSLTFDKAEYKIVVTYLPAAEDAAELSEEDLTVVLDLQSALAGTAEYDLSVSFKAGGDKAEKYLTVTAEKVKVTLTEQNKSDE